MKIYISLDMEGVAGTFDWKQEKEDRSMVRKYMSAQLEWVLEGINESAANEQVEEILIADSHSGGDSIPYEFTGLDERIQLISGGPRANYMMAGLDGTYDIAFLTGYHGGGGTLYGVMDHTYTSCFHKISFQGQAMSEALINSAFAGYHAVPVGLVIGDEALGKELQRPEQLPWVRYVTTKTGLGRFSAKSRPMGVVRRETIQAVKAVLAADIKRLPLYRFEAPIRLEIEFQTTVMADVAALIPGVRRLDGRTVELVSDDYAVLFNAYSLIARVAGTVNG